MFEKIKALISEKMELDPSLIVPTAQFVEDLKLNSLELADLVVLCEEEFGVEIDEDDIHTLLTVEDLVNYLEDRA
ncbi:MAG: acyl carrier protein [Clostridia bacterium]|nr:acyl carrier protein [Clostridia bacterium]